MAYVYIAIYFILYSFSALSTKLGSICTDLVTPVIYATTGNLFAPFLFAAFVAIFGVLASLVVLKIDQFNERKL